MNRFSQSITLRIVIVGLFFWVSAVTHAAGYTDFGSDQEPLPEPLLRPLLEPLLGPLIITHYQAHERYHFGLEVLNLALSKLDIPYAIITPSEQAMNEARGELSVIEGELDLPFMSATPQREASVIPVRIPVYQGILGLRLLLATPERQKALSQVRSVSDLQQLTGGHGANWGDLPVYAANHLPVITNSSYEGLFLQLAKNRFDYFHRGLNEIWGEAERHKDKLVIVDDVALFYPQPVFFFVTKQRPELTRKIEKGLREAHEDGSARGYRERARRFDFPATKKASRFRLAFFNNGSGGWIRL